MLLIFLDPGFLLFIIMFFVLGTIGMFMEIATTLFSIVLTGVVLVGLLVYLLHRYGSKGMIAWFGGFAIVTAGLFVMSYMQSTPNGSYNSAKSKSYIVLRAVNEFDHNGRSFTGQDIITLSWLDSKKNLTEVNVYWDSGCTSFGLGGSITTIKNQFVNNGAKQLARTNAAVWDGVTHGFEHSWDIMKLSDEEIVGLIDQTSNDLEEKKKAGHDDELNRYYDEIIGKQYGDYKTPKSGFFPGEAMEGVEITIIDRNTLKYQSGKFAMTKGRSSYYWVPIKLNTKRKYEYYLKRGLFGKIYIIINDQYKYTLETDAAYNIKRLKVYK